MKVTYFGIKEAKSLESLVVMYYNVNMPKHFSLQIYVKLFSYFYKSVINNFSKE